MCGCLFSCSNVNHKSDSMYKAHTDPRAVLLVQGCILHSLPVAPVGDLCFLKPLCSCFRRVWSSFFSPPFMPIIICPLCRLLVRWRGSSTFSHWPGVPAFPPGRPHSLPRISLLLVSATPTPGGCARSTRARAWAHTRTCLTDASNSLAEPKLTMFSPTLL